MRPTAAILTLNAKAIHFLSYFGRLAIAALAIGLLASGCQDRGFIAPPPQPSGLTLNALNTSKAEQFPSFDYKGRYLAFASDRGPARGIFVYDLQRRKLLPLPNLNEAGSFQDAPDISADGRYIVYVSERGGKPDIWIYDRASSRAENLTQNILGEVRHPTLSGNGRFVAFETNRSGQWDLQIYDRGVGVDISIPQGETEVNE
ncbi:MAG: biopolymer transporter [Cyanobacteriota bacterium]|nr:biopolymer transporter [Cyanobacteriota bacterium]